MQSTNDVMPSPTDRDFLSWLARVSPELHGVFFLDQPYDAEDAIRLGYRLALAESVWADYKSAPRNAVDAFLRETSVSPKAFDTIYELGAEAMAEEIAKEAEVDVERGESE